MADEDELDKPGWNLGTMVHVKHPKDKEMMWTKGKVVGLEGQTRINVQIEDGSMVSVDMKKSPLYTCNPKTGYDDLTSLYYLHEPGVSENLCDRYMQKNIYSYIGHVLVVCNPFQRVPMPTEKDYIGHKIGDLAPHNYAVAEDAFRLLKESEGKAPQSIIISGESGAGKTESAKIVMRYLTTVSETTPDVENLPDLVLMCNPVLEAFGNGKTVRNWNSSRFGKFTQLEFEDGKQLAGGTVQSYLLEKSRVVFQVANERNFHVFYHLFQESELDASQWGLLPKEKYHYINQSGCYDVPGIIDDKAGENGIDEVYKSLTEINDDDVEYIQEVYNVVASILWMGNIEFEGSEEAKVTGGTADAAAACAKLLQCSPDDMAFALSHSSKMVGKEIFHSPLNKKDATFARDALARAMYGRLFDDVVERINMCLGSGSGDTTSCIGVLDIFGFESFKVNLFEQFCINFTNEKLQATFNKHIFAEEVKIYYAEEIQWQGIEWPDNENALVVISGKGTGIFDTLDETCRLPRATDNKFCDMVHNKWDNKKNPGFPRTDPRISKNHFVVNHYAGNVVYCTEGWLQKNMDTISMDITDLCREKCENSLVASLWESGRFGTFTKIDKRTGAKVRTAFQGLGKKFMKSIHDLTIQIDSTHVHFVRTIKTNAAMKPDYYQPDYVIGQLRDQGLFALCDLLKAGYPTRIGYEELQERFAKSMPKEINELGLSARLYVQALVWSYGLPKSTYQCGKNKIFFRAGKVAMLDNLDKITPDQHEHLIARVHTWTIRRKWRVGAAKAIAICRVQQSFRRAHARALWNTSTTRMLIYIRTLRRNYFKVKGRVAARTINRICRMWPLRQHHLSVTFVTRERKSATLLQTLVRTKLAMIAFAEMNKAAAEKRAALMLQSLCRMVATKRETKHLFIARYEDRGSKLLQALVRMAAQRRRFQKIKNEGAEAALKVQRLFRLINGEAGVRFKSIANNLLMTRRSFFMRMEAMQTKYTKSADSVPLGKRKMGGFGGSSGFEMWCTIKIIKPEVDDDEEKEKGIHQAKWGDVQLTEDTFAATSMKMKRAPGLLGEFFKDGGNAMNKDEDGCYVWHRDPTQFHYIMDFLRDGTIDWPGNAPALEVLLDEADYFEVGPLVLALLPILKACKFGGTVEASTGVSVDRGGAAASGGGEEGPCTGYRLDMAAATFGACKCGKPKSAH